MRHLSIAATLVLLACAPQNPPGGKSLYELSESDFAQSRSELASAAAQPCGGAACLQVAKGDILLIKASGTLKTPFGDVGPDGSAWWGGTAYTLVNRPAFGLFGRINRSVFLIGYETALIAPDTGPFEILVNGCSNATGGMDGGVNPALNCSTQGSFNVSIHSKLNAGVSIATLPAITDNTTTSSTLFTLNPGADWQKTGVVLRKGQKTFLSASGSFTVQDQVSTADGGQQPTGQTFTYDANGGPSGSVGGSAYQLANRFTYRLYARVDKSIVEVGAEAAFLSPAHGELELLVNHRLPTDVSGTLAITISEGVVPARGLLQADLAAFGQTSSVTVAGDGLWKSTPVTVAKGDPIVTSASGQLTGSSIPGGTVGPDGEGGIGGYPYPLVARPRFALFGRVKEQPFFLGGQNALLAPASGTLELLVNHSAWCTTGKVCGPDAGMAGPTCVNSSLCDAAGSFTANVTAP